MSKMSEGLCRRCSNYDYVEFHELGRGMERCRIMGGVAQVPSKVTHCTSFSDNNDPYLFYEEAWVLRKRKDGELRFTPSPAARRVQEEDELREEVN